MFPDLKMRSFEYTLPSRLSSPTCEDLGIPRDEVPQTTLPQTTKCIRNLSFQDQLDETCDIKKDPFSPLSMIPVPGQFGFGVIETTFIRKRNERERDRVRCVNEGYNKLKQHLPLRNKEKRISKVETLRTAIQYIKHLESLLKQNSDDKSDAVKSDFKPRCEVKSDSMDDSETDVSDTERRYDAQDSFCSSDDDAFIT